ncbi:MAG: class I SAM-dependent methyltransferase [Candidatus Melainabacteria bacterium]|nr:class I SAM-dependent methyltransferase [Candidatus Melainabacteria bacterium]
MSKIGFNNLREEREIEHFSKLADEHGYTWWGGRTEAAKVRIKRRVELVQDLLNLKSDNIILECGCGSGDFTSGISEIINEKTILYAIDISEAQINLAKRYLNKPNVSFLSVSISNLQFKDNLFDFIIGNSILHHLNLDLALKEIKRVLKPGGKILFFEPNMANPQVWLSLNIKPLRKWYQASPDETAFWRWNIKKKVISLGFRNVSAEPFDFMHPLVPIRFIGLVRVIESFLEKTFLKEIAGSLIIYAEK